MSLRKELAAMAELDEDEQAEILAQYVSPAVLWKTIFLGLDMPSPPPNLLTDIPIEQPPFHHPDARWELSTSFIGSE